MICAEYIVSVIIYLGERRVDVSDALEQREGDVLEKALLAPLVVRILPVHVFRHRQPQPPFVVSLSHVFNLTCIVPIHCFCVQYMKPSVSVFLNHGFLLLWG